MTYVVTENCINCKYTECVEVCPVDCFYEGPNFMVIDPDGCVDCGLCATECPVDAIVPENDLDGKNKQFLQLNKELVKRWEPIFEKKAPLVGAEKWGAVEDKLEFLVAS